MKYLQSRKQLRRAFIFIDEIKTLFTDNHERRGTSALGEVIGTAADPAKKGMQKLGISELRWSIIVAGGLDGSITI